MLRSFFYFIVLIFKQKHLIVSMARREVVTTYVGSLLGFIWTFIQPLAMILVFWVVFSL
jgi:ABC-type polysaccharide/polyol phosphate export permease